VNPWQLINPRAAWEIVIVIAGIGFVNYVLLKLYGTRGVYVSVFLGGLVNSTFAVAELASPLGAGDSTSFEVAVAALLFAIVAIFARNLVILAIFLPRRSRHGRRTLHRHGNWCAYSCSSLSGTRWGSSDGNSS
jgi:uncharacterized membrane protein (DUF4010 family)